MPQRPATSTSASKKSTSLEGNKHFLGRSAPLRHQLLHQGFTDDAAALHDEFLGAAVSRCFWSTAVAAMVEIPVSSAEAAAIQALIDTPPQPSVRLKAAMMRRR